MHEIVPGIRHWTVFHENVGAPVSSYYVESAGVLIDPKVPDEGLEAFDGFDVRPQQVVLTSGNHTRDAAAFAEAFGCVIRASPEGAERIGGALDTKPYRDGEDIAPGVHAVHIGILSADEYALHLTPGDGAIVVADGITHYGDSLGFFPDELLGEDPQAVKDGLKQRFQTVLEREFEDLLFAHGDPIVGSGKTALRAFVTSPVGHEDYGQSR
jgi:hypothetical protein